MLYEWLCDNDFILEDGEVYMVIEFLYTKCNPPKYKYIYDVAHNVWREKHFCFQALDHDTFVLRVECVPMLQAIIYDRIQTMAKHK